MKKTKRFIALLLALLLSSALCSCSGGEDDETEPAQPGTQSQAEKPQGSLTLPIAHNDTLDPFKDISTVNRSLVTLLYDSLVTVDSKFQPQPLLAASFKQSGTELNVVLKSAVFSDGTALSAQDVIYSFEQAKKSSYYAARLSGFSSAGGNGNTVTFKLSSPNIYAAACLDFPIVKNGTVEYQAEGTENYKITPPIGSGRYVISGTLPNASLVLNSKCSRTTKPKISRIELFEVSDSDGLAYGLQIGNYDYWYNDLSSGRYSRVNAGLSVVPTNNLVYLGFNADKKIFQQPEVRRAVSMLLSREEIVAQGFQGHAAAAVLPFNPAWYAMAGISSNGSAKVQTEVAKQVLEAAGYTSVNVYGYRCSSRLSLNCTLTVCKDNAFKTAAAKQIQQQLAALNFNVKIIELSYDDYTKAIAEGNFEMYLGEIKLPASMSLNEFFTESGAANTLVYQEVEEGVQEFTSCADAYFKLRSGEYSMSDFCRLFETEMPFVPICYRNAAQVYSRRFKTEINGTCYDNFYNIETWEIKPTTEEEK